MYDLPEMRQQLETENKSLNEQLKILSKDKRIAGEDILDGISEDIGEVLDILEGLSEEVKNLNLNNNQESQLTNDLMAEIKKNMPDKINEILKKIDDFVALFTEGYKGNVGILVGPIRKLVNQALDVINTFVRRAEVLQQPKLSIARNFHKTASDNNNEQSFSLKEMQDKLKASEKVLESLAKHLINDKKEEAGDLVVDIIEKVGAIHIIIELLQTSINQFYEYGSDEFLLSNEQIQNCQENSQYALNDATKNIEELVDLFEEDVRGEVRLIVNGVLNNLKTSIKKVDELLEELVKVQSPVAEI